MNVNVNVAPFRQKETQILVGRVEYCESYWLARSPQCLRQYRPGRHLEAVRPLALAVHGLAHLLEAWGELRRRRVAPPCRRALL